MRQRLLAAELPSEDRTVAVDGGRLDKRGGRVSRIRHRADSATESHIERGIVRAPLSEDDVDPCLMLAIVVMASGVIDRERVAIGIHEASHLLVEGTAFVTGQALD